MSLLGVIVGVYLLAWIVGGGRGDRPSVLGSLLIKTVQVFVILLIVWLAYRTLPFFRDVVHGFLGTLHGIFWW